MKIRLIRRTRKTTKFKETLRNKNCRDQVAESKNKISYWGSSFFHVPCPGSLTLAITMTKAAILREAKKFPSLSYAGPIPNISESRLLLSSSSAALLNLAL